MGLYQTFKTDNQLERDGVILSYGVNSKGKPIEIRIARAGGSNMKFAKRMEAAVKPYKRQIQNEVMDNEQALAITRQVFAETVVLGWENVEDENGDELPFSPEACVKLFEDLPDLFADVQEQSQRIALFRQELREDASKN